MLLFFADDSKQASPSRPGLGSLVAAGAVRVREEEVRVLELQLSKVCADFGFPDGEEFKWSPGRECWMRSNLVDDNRAEFYRRVLEAGAQRGVSATVVIADSSPAHASGNAFREEDVTRKLLEAIHLQIPIDSQGLVVADRPGGDREQEDDFLEACIAAVKSGTREVRSLELIALTLTTNSRMVRLLQLADLITSCTTAMVAGSVWAGRTFQHILPLLDRAAGRVGGLGLRIYPPDRYANLYHWIARDGDYVHHNASYQLPMPGYPYAAGENAP